MKQEALEKLEYGRPDLKAAVLDILASEPDGVKTRKIMFRLEEHPGFPFDASPKYIYVWMAELKRDDVVVIDHPNKRYLHPMHADAAPDADRYRPNGTSL